MEDKKTFERTHRVGTITTGVSMMVFGIMFLVHLTFGALSYTMIFSFWPIILIGLGAELLFSNFSKTKIIYDKASIFLTIVMSFFAMSMAILDVCIKAGAAYINL